MKRGEGHTGVFSPRDPPLATGKRLRDEPGEGFGASFPAPRPCVVMAARAASLCNPARSVPQFTLGGEEGGARGADEQLLLLVPCGLMNELL